MLRLISGIPGYDPKNMPHGNGDKDVAFDLIIYGVALVVEKLREAP